MDAKTGTANEPILLDPPTFVPPPEMRGGYLARRRAELEAMFDSARAGVWKPVITIANHVRGTGRMYNFAAIGDAAENLAKAIQNGDMKCMEYLETYAKVIGDAKV